MVINTTTAMTHICPLTLFMMYCLLHSKLHLSQNELATKLQHRPTVTPLSKKPDKDESIGGSSTKVEELLNESNNTRDSGVSLDDEVCLPACLTGFWTKAKEYTPCPTL